MFVTIEVVIDVALGEPRDGDPELIFQLISVPIDSISCIYPTNTYECWLRQKADDYEKLDPDAGWKSRMADIYFRKADRESEYWSGYGNCLDSFKKFFDRELTGIQFKTPIDLGQIHRYGINSEDWTDDLNQWVEKVTYVAYSPQSMQETKNILNGNITK